MSSQPKFKIFNPKDDNTFVYGLKVLNKMKSGNEKMPYKYDVVDGIMNMALAVDAYQTNDGHGSFFGEWAEDDNPVYQNENNDDTDIGDAYSKSSNHENAYILAFLLGDKEIIGKYKCVYGSKSTHTINNIPNSTWYEVLKYVTNRDPYPDFYNYDDRKVSKICPSYDPTPEPTPPKPNSPTPTPVKGLQALGFVQKTGMPVSQKVYIGVGVFIFILVAFLLVKFVL
jgi:hypothetical protein